MERQPPVVQLRRRRWPFRASGSSAWPRRVEWSAAASSPIAISFTRSKPWSHDFHVGVDDRFAQLAELLDVLLADDFAVLLLGDAELLQQGADREEGAEEGVALHAELKVGAVGRLAGNFETGQREDANVFLDDLLAGPEGQVLPRALAFRIRLPDEAPPCWMPSSGLVWVKALGSQQRTTVTWRRSQLTRMRSLAATMK